MSMITSLSNEKIKAARKLHSKAQRRRTGKLLIEGVRLIKDAVQSGFDPEYVFFAPDITTSNVDAAELVEALRSRNVACAPVSAQVFTSISETVTPQGVVAVVRMPVLPVSENPSLILILDGISDPGNAGTLMRSAEAAGADLVLFAPGAVDAFNDKVLRAGMGAHFRLPMRQCMDWQKLWQSVGLSVTKYVADADAELTYDAVDWCESVALIVGSEASGPSAEAYSAATGVTIPMYGPVESLNAAMAGTILLFEAARQRSNYVHDRR